MPRGLLSDRVPSHAIPSRISAASLFRTVNTQRPDTASYAFTQEMRDPLWLTTVEQNATACARKPREGHYPSTISAPAGAISSIVRPCLLSRQKKGRQLISGDKPGDCRRVEYGTFGGRLLRPEQPYRQSSAG